MTLQAWFTLVGKTQADFAKEIGVYQSSVSRWAKGERMPKPYILRKIAMATGGRVTADDFMVLQSTQGDDSKRVA